MNAQTGFVRRFGSPERLQIQGLPTIWNPSSKTKPFRSATAKVAKTGPRGRREGAG
jgi:hypothetical protein